MAGICVGKSFSYDGVFRPQTFEFLEKSGISQITFFRRSRRLTFILKVTYNLILHILIYKSTNVRKKNFNQKIQKILFSEFVFFCHHRKKIHVLTKHICDLKKHIFRYQADLNRNSRHSNLGS